MTGRVFPIVWAYALACAAGASVLAVFGISVQQKTAAEHVVSWLFTGVFGGISALPLALPLVLAAEYWRWRHPAIYILATPFVWATATCDALLLILILDAGASDSTNASSLFRFLILTPIQGPVFAAAAAVTAYWTLRGRLSGAHS